MKARAFDERCVVPFRIAGRLSEAEIAAIRAGVDEDCQGGAELRFSSVDAVLLMEWADGVALASLAVSIIAILYQVAVDLRGRREHRTWTADLFREVLSQELLRKGHGEYRIVSVDGFPKLLEGAANDPCRVVVNAGEDRDYLVGIFSDGETYTVALTGEGPAS
jgi:hypothetical protein